MHRLIEFKKLLLGETDSELLSIQKCFEIKGDAVNDVYLLWILLQILRK